MRLATLDIAIVLAYLAGIFILAQVVSREKAGHQKSASDYFLASRSLPWWAIGASLIAANISAEQIIGMSGSGYAIGLAIASYEWMAAATLLIVGKFFLPIFLRNKIYTMPQFLEERYGTSIRTLMAVFWLGLYVFVNITSILWLGAIAVNQVTGMDQMTAVVLIGVFALVYQLYGGLKAVALTDIVQVTLLVLGGLLVAGLTLSKLGDGAGIAAGFSRLWAEHPGHFEMILSKDNPFYKDLPGISVLVGGMWIMNVSYWGFNQYIIQRALAAKDLKEAQKGVLFAAFLKLLMPVIVVVPGIAAVMLAPTLDRPDQAYPTMMGLLPTGILGLVFAALVAAIVASLASKINSVATIFTLDFYAKMRPDSEQPKLVRVGRIVAALSVLVGILAARPLLGSFDQAFQYIQEYTGFFTPGIVVIFMLGLFWKRANQAGALAAAIGSFVLSVVLKLAWPGLPFIDRVGLVFLLALALAVVVSLATAPQREGSDLIRTDDVSYSTTAGFNFGALGVVAILVALYAIFW
ncbi:SSS sodium solute transporter superfamily [Pseudoxanthomonas suwonensis 11-1]|uniref:SSS sodium solute transporter superfamily n=1 Tax=Pseudoxanthomonas suwonensis (strain 11-1) TaxID=743721 RepID=E6WP35_PSEUU|nr:sodium/sugar symporter [Pseudoxanthomonas suwonensis]ADV25934.1 SSS sodium solute transporter superfamily [Pseudoxanthomonas suwonensis 11-1]